MDAFNAAVSEAYRHYRGAVFYLRTGNAAVASMELEDMREEWRRLEARFGDTPSGAFAKDPAFRATLREIGAATGNAIDLAIAGDAKSSAAAAAPVRRLLAALRARNGVRVFSDCVNEANAAGAAILVFRPRPHDFDDRNWVNGLRSAAASVSDAYRRCRDEAPAAIHKDAAFKRLIAGVFHEMSQVLQAIDARDSRLLSISLGEFRSFDRILFLNFG